MISVKIRADSINDAIQKLENIQEDYDNADMEDGDSFLGCDIEIERID